jgi:hypothetical protein
MTLEQARDHIGARVLYRRPGAEPEAGVIARVSERYVFVEYPVVKATYPDDLELLEGAN